MDVTATLQADAEALSTADKFSMSGSQWGSVDGEELGWNYKQMLSERWKAAVKQAKSKLDKSDYQTIQNFGSGEALIADLKRMQIEADSRTGFYSRVTSVMLPFVKTVNMTAGMFMIAMAPHAPELAVLWGLVYLMMTLSLESNDKWVGFVERLNDIRQSLIILNICARIVDIPAEEINTAIFNVFTSLINFWVAAVKWIRSHHLDSPLGLDGEFARSMNRVESSIRHLKDLAQLDGYSRAALRGAQLARQAEMFSSLGDDDDKAKYPVTLLPQAVNNAAFFGRDGVLSDIEAILDTPDTSTPILRSILLHGMGGVGKTQTAMNYAHTRRENYDVILWIRSETSLSLNSSMKEIARHLLFPGSDSPGSDETKLSNFHKWLRRQAAKKSGRRWLLIYDNFEKIDDGIQRYMPTTSGSVIITSRNLRAGLQGSEIVSLKPFSDKIGGQFLRKLLRYPEKQVSAESDREATTSLAREVDGLPLGIRHMAGLMNERGETSAAKFLAMYLQYPRELMMEAGPVVDYEKDISRSGDEHPLDRVWTISFASLKLPQRTLLGIVSFLSPDEIPQYLFGDGATQNAPVGDLQLVCGGIRLDNALVGLANGALIGRNSNPFTIHRLVQDAFRQWCDKEELGRHFAAAVHVVYQSFPHQVNGRPMHDCWNKCRDLIQHGQTLADRFKELRQRSQEVEAPPNLAELLKSCAWYLFEMADHPSAIRILEIAITACPDKESELYAHLLNTIGCCSFELSDLRRCREVWDVALVIRETWTKTEGNYDSALQYFDRAKGIRLRLGDGAIVPLGVTYMTTGRTLFLKGKHDEALAEYKKAQNIFVAKFGQNAHFMAHLNYAYGNLELSRQNNAAAQKYYGRAKDILEKDTPLHLLMAACYYKLAHLSEIEGKRDEALKLLDKGLTIAEFREGRGDVARIVRKKAAILEAGSDEEQDTARMLMHQVHNMVIRHLPDAVFSLGGDTDEDWDSWVCPYWR